MANTLHITKSNVTCGLGTYIHTTVAAGRYGVEVTVTEDPTSAISIVVQLNGSPVATSVVPTTRQRHIELIVPGILCAVSDVISVVISSSLDLDKQLNTVQGMIVVKQVP